MSSARKQNGVRHSSFHKLGVNEFFGLHGPIIHAFRKILPLPEAGVHDFFAGIIAVFQMAVIINRKG